MKNLLASVNWSWLKEFQIYIWAAVISATVVFLKKLLKGDNQSYDNLKKATNEGIHLRQYLKGKGIYAYLKAGISYCLYSLRCLIDKAEPAVMFAGSVLVISYCEKNLHLIDAHLFNKLPTEFQELRPSIPKAIGAVYAVFINRLLRLIKLLLPSFYTLPTSTMPKSEETREQQITATILLRDIQNNINSNGNSNNVVVDTQSSRSVYIPSAQFNEGLLNSLKT